MVAKRLKWQKTIWNLFTEQNWTELMQKLSFLKWYWKQNLNCITFMVNYCDTTFSLNSWNKHKLRTRNVSGFVRCTNVGSSSCRVLSSTLFVDKSRLVLKLIIERQYQMFMLWKRKYINKRKLSINFINLLRSTKPMSSVLFLAGCSGSAAHLVSLLENFFNTHFPRSFPRRSEINLASCWWEFPPNIFMFGIFKDVLFNSSKLFIKRGITWR